MVDFFHIATGWVSDLAYISIIVKLTSFLFVVGLLGVFVLRRDLVTVIISIELSILAAVINFIFFSTLHSSLLGEIFVLFILVVAAAETALALAIVVTFYQLTNIGGIDLQDQELE